jgi:hypothetical protein
VRAKKWGRGKKKEARSTVQQRTIPEQMSYASNGYSKKASVNKSAFLSMWCVIFEENI